jgi:hypothetical protein
MKKLICDTYDCANTVEVPSSVPAVICGVCVTLGVNKIRHEQAVEVEKLKTKQSEVPVYKRKRWSKTEDMVIFDFVQTHTISQLMEMLPGRTASAVENRIWNLKMEHVAKQKYIDQIV